MNNSKVAPIISKATLINKTNTTQSASITPSTSGFHFKPYTIASSSTNAKSNTSTNANASKVTGKDEKKKDVKKIEGIEKKKEEKLKQKAEKAAKKVQLIFSVHPKYYLFLI